MQWKFNQTGEQFNFIYAYAQVLLKDKKNIVGWLNPNPIWNDDRLEADFHNGKYTLKIINGRFQDTGNYSIKAQLTKNKQELHSTVSVRIHGMFFSN